MPENDDVVMTIIAEAAPPQKLTIEEYEVFFNSLGFSLSMRDIYDKTESL